MTAHDLTEWELRDTTRTHVTATMWPSGAVTFHRTTECAGTGLFVDQSPVRVEYMARQFALDQAHDRAGEARNHRYCGRCVVRRVTT